MDIKILGMGCANCDKLYKMTQKLIADLGIEAQLSKVEEPMRILSLGAMRTPAILIDGVIVHSGSVPKEDQLKEMIEKAL